MNITRNDEEFYKLLRLSNGGDNKQAQGDIWIGAHVPPLGKCFECNLYLKIFWLKPLKALTFMLIFNVCHLNKGVSFKMTSKSVQSQIDCRYSHKNSILWF